MRRGLIAAIDASAVDRRTIRLLLLGAAVLDVIFPLVVAGLDAVDDIDPVRRTLSLHALRAGFPWMGLAFIAHAFALEMLAAALRRLPPQPYAAPVALRLAGAAAALLAILHPDAPGTESVMGHLHESLALVAFLGIATAGLFAANSQRRDPHWVGLWRLPAGFAFALLTTLAGLGVLVLLAQLYDPLKGYYGLAERIVVACIGAWMVSTAVQGIRVTRRTDAATRAPPARGLGP